MNKLIHRAHCNTCLGFFACLGLSWLLSCSSVDEAPGGGRVEHPVEPRPSLSAPLVASGSSPPRAPSSNLALPSASPSASPPRRQLTPSEFYEESTGIQLSPADKAIMDDCPSHALSKKVPKRACTKDEQCGDGFCDRGRCGAIWTCTVEYGQRCENDEKCGVHYLCMDGRCRSCVSDGECKSTLNNGNPKCRPDPFYVPNSRQCRGSVPSIVPLTGSQAPSQPVPK